MRFLEPPQNQKRRQVSVQNAAQADTAPPGMKSEVAEYCAALLPDLSGASARSFPNRFSHGGSHADPYN